MKKNSPHLTSYLAALVIGMILFATFWKWLVGPASSVVFLAGTMGVMVAVTLYLVYNRIKHSDNDER